jgi:hypothetical protein
VAVAFAAIAMPASGEVILEIGAATAARGSTGNTIEVDVENPGASAITIGGFNFEIFADSDIDFTGAGFATLAPYIFSGDSFDQLATMPLNSTTGSSLSAGDISASGNGEVLAAGQTAGLGLVTFSLSPTAAPGPITVSFSTNFSDTNLSDQNGTSIPIIAFLNGTINGPNVVPEPPASALLLAGLMGLGVWRLRRMTPG